MTIIKPGIRPEDILYEYDCSYCGCIFQFHENELYSKVDTPYYTERIIECPCCKRRVCLNKLAFEGHRVKEESK